METLLPDIAAPEGAVDPAALFPSAARFAVEIGFGAGDHLAAQAARSTSTGFIAAEFFMEGVGKALARIDDAGLANIRLMVGDARPLLERIAPASVDIVYLLFPDPWPKRRHWKRRFISPETVVEIARILKPGGRLRVATDVKSYAAWTLLHVRANPAFCWCARSPADWRTPPQDHVGTRYERKGLGDSAPIFMDFERV